jgi:hypothetical protein
MPLTKSLSLLLFLCAPAASQKTAECPLPPADCIVREGETFAVSDSSSGRNPDAREDWLRNPVPHPFLYFGPSVMGGGYASITYRFESGIDVESSHFLARALGAYDDGHKVDDGDQPNPKGHDRYLDGAVYYRLHSGWPRGLYFGGGYTWSQLSTTNYTKGGGRYQLGGGYDIFQRSCNECRRDFSIRVNMDWITAGQDWQNGSHGPNTTVTMPSPIEKRHWFLVDSVAIYRFHQTVTEPNNPPLVQFQRAKKYFDGNDDVGIVYRF